MDEGLDELSQLIIRATGAEKDLPFETRLVIEKALKESVEHEDKLKKLLPRLLLPEELLFSLEEHHPLVSSANLTPEHPEFKPLSLLIAEMRDLMGPLQKEKLSPPVFSALGAIEAYYADFIPKFCKATSEERRQLLATRARMRGERIGAYLRIPANPVGNSVFIRSPVPI